MLSKADFVRVADNIWEIPPTFRDYMRVPARLYADESRCPIFTKATASRLGESWQLARLRE